MRRALIYLLYRIALAAGFPLVLGYLLARSLRSRQYASSVAERCGWLPPLGQTETGGIWLHAVSAGEVMAAVPLLTRLRRDVPSVAVYVSVGTLAGRTAAAARLSGLADFVFFAPVDYVCVVRRVLRRLRPGLVVVVETEIWPNLWREARRCGASLMVVNGRVSDRAWPRYQAWRRWFAPVLEQANLILAQTEDYRGRYLALGARPGSVVTAGNLKYDFEPGDAPPDVRRLIESRAPSAVWIAASTMPPAGPGDVDEDEAVLDAFVELARRHPRLLLVLVPRRPERFETAAAILSRRAVRFVRRSSITRSTALELPGVLLLDTVGELAAVFGLADVVFMGGTLARRGGHNILEPAWHAKPVIVGPHLENFPEIAADFRAARALVEIPSASGLAPAVEELLADAAARERLADLGRKLARARTGSAAQAARHVIDWYEKGVPCPLRPWIERISLGPISWLWRAGAALHKAAARPRRLPVPVVCAGNITTGGSGKTPVVIALARGLAERGLRPAFLTRGYGRRNSLPLVLEAGAGADVTGTGDEAAILLSSGLGPVAIDDDRFRGGSGLIARFSPGVVLMDDGFQHWALAREVDLVLIDALDPFGSGGILPLGRLREPLSGLARASAFVITRARPGRTYAGIRAVLGAIRPEAPVFTCSMNPVSWVDARSGERKGTAPPAPAVTAFCGLGNPDSFWATLAGLGITPVRRRRFPDHHHYRAADIELLERLARESGSHALLATRKDIFNIDPQCLKRISVPLYWLDAEAVIGNPDEFFAWLGKRLGGSA